MESRFAPVRGVMSFCIVLVSAANLSPRLAAAQDTTSTRTLSGVVVDAKNGKPLVGAFVTFIAQNVGGYTDKNGRFEITSAPLGVATVRVRAIGYVAQTVAITNPAATPLTIALFRDINTLGPPVIVGPPGTTLRPVTVYGTRTDLEEAAGRVFRTPGGVAMVDAEALRQTRQANLKDALALTPGVYVQSRFGAADESQISVRGSGLRDNFHARGINLLVNGMPYRNADGFTDFESLELLTTDAMEVYKGGNALQYGGSTLGGAINLDTKTGYNTGGPSPYLEGGSYGFFKGQLETGGKLEGGGNPLYGERRWNADYYASYAHTSLDGYRNWSGQKRDRVNLHAGYQFSSRIDARAFYFFAKIGEHLPGSLDRATFDSAPRSADPTNLAGRWGRNYNLHHLGTQLRVQISPSQRLEFSPYLQFRDIDHPIFEVISQVSHDYGAELRYAVNEFATGRHANQFVVAAQTAWERMQNRQYVNQAGAHGALTKDQRDAVNMTALYGEDRFNATSALTLVAGARLESSDRRTRDFFLSDGDQSDVRRYKPFTPRVGLLYTHSLATVFANVSKSFEPPLLLELNSLTVPGFVKLAGQGATQYEVGTRTFGPRFNVDVAAYDVELRNEIINLNVRPFPGATFTVPTYRNSPRTRHSGIEAGLDYQIASGVFASERTAEQGPMRGTDSFSLRAAYTLGMFQFVRDSAYSGNQIPGAPRHHITAEVKYSHPIGVTVTPSVEWVPQSYFVNSANTARNNGWHTIGLRVEWLPISYRSHWEMFPSTRTSIFLSAQNLENRSYSGSVQVDNAAGKYFEPSDRRTFYFGARWVPQ